MSIREYALDTVGKLFTNFASALGEAARAKNPDAIHDLRVSVRRFTQSLLTFEEYFSRKRLKKIRRNLKELMGLAAEMRNRDIALEFLKENEEPSLGHNTLRARLDHERQECEREFAGLLDRWQEEALADRWKNVLRGKGGETVAEVLRVMLPRLARDYFAEGRAASAGPLPHGELHRFRLKSKRFRYTMEMFAPFYGPAFQKMLSKLRDVQSHLGKISDCATLAELFQDQPALTSEMIERGEKRAEDFRKYWKTGFDIPGEEARWTRYLARPRAGV
jgi:CHAD domain-containing protein